MARMQLSHSAHDYPTVTDTLIFEDTKNGIAAIEARLAHALDGEASLLGIAGADSAAPAAPGDDEADEEDESSFPCPARKHCRSFQQSDGGAWGPAATQAGSCGGGLHNGIRATPGTWIQRR